jgi:predicted flap endonuclease-1-like 5' DNA nuclease
VRPVIFHNPVFGDNPPMDGFFSDIGPYILAALAAGLAVGWVLKSALSKGQVSSLEGDWRKQLDDTNQKRNSALTEVKNLQSAIEAQEAVVHERELAISRAQTEISSAQEKEKLMAENIFSLRSEREGFKVKMSAFQSRMALVQQQAAELQTEFLKSRDFYVGELKKSFEKRKAVEEKLDNSFREHDSVRNLLDSSKSEQDSINKMLEAARLRLENLDALEQNVNKLEAENAQLKLDSSLARQENDALQRDVAEQEELRVKIRELSQVVKSMENARNQHENDANRYRENADKHESKSETLQLRLDEVEQNFMELEKQQRNALDDARRPAAAAAKAAAKATNGKTPAQTEQDDLKDIIGIGKVFEHSLHELGIVSFRQIANFDVSDIARVNSELKEFKGRMEQDDWIGQAKDLFYKKYGTA